MNIKKVVYDSIAAKLRKEQRGLRYHIRQNKRAMHELVEAQTRSKRELAAIEELIRNMGATV